MKLHCLQLWSTGDTAHRRLPSRFDRFYIGSSISRSHSSVPPPALYLPSMSRLSFSAVVTHRISRVVLPRGIPTYLHNLRLLLRLSAFYLSLPGVRVQYAFAPLSFRPPFSPVTNGDILVSSELGSGSHCLCQVRRFPFVKT